MLDRLFENVTDEDVRTLIAGGEGSQVEFKPDITNVFEMAELASAFANTEGGVLLVGVREPDILVGCNAARVGHIIEKLEKRIKPMPVLRKHGLTYQGFKLAIVVFKRSHELAISDAGAFRRVGAKNELMTAKMVQELIPPDESSDVTNQHLLRIIEEFNKRIDKVHKDVNYHRTIKGRVIVFGLGFFAGVFGRVLGAGLLHVLGWN